MRSRFWDWCAKSNKNLELQEQGERAKTMRVWANIDRRQGPQSPYSGKTQGHKYQL